MTDISLTIAPKSDQLNADDLIGGVKIITITKVSANPNSAEQPISINFEGDNGKPYKPCKSMRRVLVQVWGKDGTVYGGRGMTLYRDAKVQFGGLEVGGIRISHMSHIDRDVTMALTATRASRKPFTVKPLKAESPKQAETPRRTITQFLDDLQRDLTEALGSADPRPAVDAVLGHPDVKRAEDKFTNDAQERLQGIIQTAVAQLAERSSEPDDGFPTEAAA